MDDLLDGHDGALEEFELLSANVGVVFERVEVEGAHVSFGG